MRPISTSSKRGQLNTLAPAIIALVLAGLLLIFGLIIMQELRDTDVITKANAVTVNNETLAAMVPGTGVLVARSGDVSFGGFGVITVYNNSGAVQLDTGNFTIAANGLVNGSTSAIYNDTVWNVTYSFTHGDEAFSAANLTVVGLGTFANFWEIIVITVILMIVIGLLLVTFGGSRRR